MTTAACIRSRLKPSERHDVVRSSTAIDGFHPSYSSSVGWVKPAEESKGDCEVNPVQADLYPSRQHDEPSWQARLDPVVYRNDLADAPIAADQIERFERDGYLVIPNLFSAGEVAVFREELERMRERPAQ